MKNTTQTKQNIQRIKEIIKKASEKASTLEGPRQDRLKGAIARLRDLLPYEYVCKGITKEYAERKKLNTINSSIRLCLNNERKGIDFEFSLENFYYDCGLKIPKLLEATTRLAENGDPLAKRIMEHSTSIRLLTNYSDEAMKKLITREISEQRYNDYLSGKLPIGRCKNGEEFYLREHNSEDLNTQTRAAVEAVKPLCLERGRIE